jgi:hypothetical protein
MNLSGNLGDTVVYLKKKKPTAVIFLDCDGVIMGDRFIAPLNDLIIQTAAKLFKKNQGLTCDYTGFEWRVATSHHFDPSALQMLNDIISKIELNGFNVEIVISSAWRKSGTVDQVVNEMFKACNFSKYIVDKTPDDNEPNINELSLTKYGFKPGMDRSLQIAYWLGENWEKRNIQSFVILDDKHQTKLSSRFPRNFIHVNEGNLLQLTHVQMAHNILLNTTFDTIDVKQNVIIGKQVSS